MEIRYHEDTWAENGPYQCNPTKFIKSEIKYNLIFTSIHPVIVDIKSLSRHITGSHNNLPCEGTL